MNFLDIILLLPLLWGVYKGFSKGLVVELASIVALILGIYLSIHCSGYAAKILVNSFGLTSKYINLIAFAVTFIAVIFIVYALAKLIEKLLDLVALKFINKLLGALLSLLKYAFILSVILFIINAFDTNKKLIGKKQRSQSYLYSPLSAFAPFILPVIKNIDTQNMPSLLKDDMIKEYKK
ncbi:MAG: CvpA family protein [Bacteroidales bacterium]|nr:CvpA family protein [Bacteroidales bacterium]